MKSINLCGRPGQCCPHLEMKDEKGYAIVERQNGKSIVIMRGRF